MRLGKRTARLVREAMVLGFAEGAQWGHYGWKPLDQDPDYPKDSEVCRRVLRAARSFDDLYPLLSRVEREDSA